MVPGSCAVSRSYFAVPYSGLEPAKGKELIARANTEGRGGGGGKGSGGHRPGSGKKGQPPMPGTKDRGEENPDAKALSKSETDKLEKSLPNLDNVKIRVVKSRPKEGKTAIHEERRPDGTLRYTAYLGDQMHDHTAGMRYSEEHFGEKSRDAEYRPASDAEHAEKRKQTLQGTNPNTKDEEGNKRDTVNEEKPPASVHLIPVDLDKIGEKPPPTVIKGTGVVSRKMDAQLVKKIVTKYKEAGTGSTMRFRGNPSPHFRANPPNMKYLELRIYPLRYSQTCQAYNSVNMIDFSPFCSNSKGETSNTP